MLVGIVRWYGRWFKGSVVMINLKQNYSVAKFLLYDVIRRRLMVVVSFVMLCLYRILAICGSSNANKYLMAAHRYYRSDYLDGLVKSQLAAIASHCEDYLKVDSVGEKDWTVLRSIVLKNPVLHQDQIEKGVLLVKFSTTLPFVIRDLDCEQLLEWFWLVIEPSWSSYCAPELLYWARFANAPIIIESSEITDYRFLKKLEANFVPVSYGSSDWVDERIFTPQECGKEYDAIFIAGYYWAKRHHRFLKAVSAVKKNGYRAAMVCTPWGDFKQDVQRLLQFYDVVDCVDVFEGVPPEELSRLISMSKVNVLLSLKEGSNRSIFEGFFADVPGIVLEENMGVNKTYINQYTGHLIADKDLEDSLAYFSREWRSFKPRAWALENISPLVTTKKLNEQLMALAAEAGDPWTVDIVPKVNSPEAIYYHAADGDRLLSMEKLKQAFAREQIVDSNKSRLAMLGITKE